MNIKQNLFFFISLLILFSSCSVEKRHYNSGYHIDWKQNNKSVQEAEPKKNNLRTEDQDLLFHSNLAGVEPASLIPARTDLLNEVEQFKPVADDKCDLIVLQNGTEIKAMIRKVGYTEIIYKPCPGNTKGNYSVQKSKVFLISYKDGVNDTINSKKEFLENISDTTASHKNNLNQTVTDPNALISLVAGLLVPFVYFTAPVAIIFGFISLSKIRRSDGKLKGRGFAITGIVLGFLGVLFALFLLLLILAFAGIYRN